MSRSSEACDETGRQHLEALEQVVRQSNLDGAITTLTALAHQPAPDPRVWSDLAAAFMVRARRQDRPSDLLRALSVARTAVAAPDPPPEALFNLALAEELLQLPWQAARTWAIYLGRPDDPRWAAAGRSRRDRLERQELRTAATVWPLNRLRLPEAVRLGDREAVAQLVAPFPGAAQRWVEEQVLPAWARMTEAGDPRATPRLVEAQAIAGAVARATGDRYLRDVVAVVADADRRRDAATLRALARGHALFGEARQLSREITAPDEEERYRQAGAELAAAGSPLRTSAEIGAAAALYRRLPAHCPRVLAMLEPLEATARRSGSGSLLGKVLWSRGLCLVAKGLFPEALEVYEEALAAYRRVRDPEGVANVRARLAGAARELGDRELAWRQAWQTLRDLRSVVETERQHYILGEAALAALALDEPQTALLMQTESIDRLREDLAPLPPDDQLAAGLRQNLGIALRGRGLLLAFLDRHEAAQADVQEANLYLDKAVDEGVRDALLARAKEAEARTLLASDPQAAIELLRDAIDLYPPEQFRTYRASLHFQLARAHRNRRDPAGAEEALKAGLEEIAAEEERVLDLRRPGESEERWGPYFSRFGEAHQQLVRLLMDQERDAEAFAYAERARALEPLDLVLRLRSAPRRFERLIAQREPLGLAEVQAQLPAGTFLLDFYFLDEKGEEPQLVIWIVGREQFESLRPKIDHRTIAEWVEDLRAARETGDTESVVEVLERAFAALLAAPLARLDRSQIERLVFVPDRALHGLPLAALRDRRAKRHLVEDFPIEVAPSATLYVFSLLRDRELRGEPASALLVGDPVFDKELEVARDLEPLEWAGHEVAAIKRFYGPLAERLAPEQATVDSFLRRAAAKTVVHFAGHAVANDDAPSRSVLLLARSATHSGALTAEELLSRLELRKTRLVVLSACSSAGGRSIGSSGLAPLVRPFLAGGVPAVVGTLWNVSDSSSADLLVSFHEHLAAGEDAARALREAQLEVIRKQGTKAELVLVWAPFQVVGHASSPFPPN
ncbi:MAG TPA: CHAT domain-containing protein [Thermoanaerobaculia bacterium]|nr:CHAT domain-containing protein [Thermoanaerobaculia bacterium]